MIVYSTEFLHALATFADGVVRSAEYFDEATQKSRISGMSFEISTEDGPSRQQIRIAVHPETKVAGVIFE